MFENRCRRCKRKLKDPFALYGRVCAEKVGYKENDNSWYDVHDSFGSYLMYLRKEYNNHLKTSGDSYEDSIKELRLVEDIQKKLNTLGFTDNEGNQLEITGVVNDSTDEAWSKYLDSQSKYNVTAPVGYENKEDFDIISDFAVIKALEREFRNYELSLEDRNAVAFAIEKIKSPQSSKFTKKNKSEIKISVDTVARHMEIFDRMEKANKFYGNFYLPTAVAALGIDALQNQWEEVGKDVVGLGVSKLPISKNQYHQKDSISFIGSQFMERLHESPMLIYKNDLIIDISLENSVHRRYVYNIYENTLKEVYNGVDENEIIEGYQAPPNLKIVFGKIENEDFLYQKTYLRNDGKVIKERAGESE